MEIAEHFASLGIAPDALFANAQIVHGSGGSVRIASWNETVLGPRPSDAELAAIATSPTPGPATGELLNYASSKQNEALAEVWTFDVGTTQAPKRLTTRLDPAGQSAMLEITVWAQVNASTSGADLPYSNVDFTSTTLSAEEAANLGSKAGAAKIESYSVLNQVAAGIKDGSITTTSQIDTAFAAISA